MNKAVQVELNSFTYEGADEPVLRDLNFFFDYGQVTLLFGISGSGKSTLLSLINGVIPRVTSGTLDGRILVNGEDTSGYSMSRISRKVGSVLQNAQEQIIHETVEDEIAFGCENLGVAPDEIERRIEAQCGFMSLERGWATRTLSGGQKQRLVTGSTLAMGADILIFDEPLANLDRKGGMELLSRLRDLAKEGKAVLLVEHRLDVVLPYVDVVWQLRDGSAFLVPDKNSYLRSQINVIEDFSSSALADHPLALKAEQLVKRFAKRIVLDGVSFDLSVGERLLLLGENGCGKSTLLSILARLIKPDGGTIKQFFDPSLTKKADRRWFGAVGFVYQNPNYQLFMPSVSEELTFSAYSKEYAFEMAERFGLTPLLARHPHSLSEGQKRKLTIAAIMAQKPMFLILAAPTVGQDYASLKQMIATLNAIHREQGNTMVTVTHDFRCAAALCDRALWLSDGIVISQGGKELAEDFFLRDSQAIAKDK